MQTWVLSRNQGMAPEAGWAVTAESGAGLNTWALGLAEVSILYSHSPAGRHSCLLPTDEDIHPNGACPDLPSR